MQSFGIFQGVSPFLTDL